MLRITNSGTTARLLQRLQTVQTRLAETQERMGTGKRINRPSDDPFGNSRVLSMRTTLNQLAQYQRGVEVAKSELAATEAGLASLSRVMDRAQELSVQADSSSVDGSGRIAIALEVDLLIQEAVTVGNTSYGGRRIFGGYQSATLPFVPDASVGATAVTFQGDAGVVSRSVGDSESVAVSVDGQAVFGGVFTSLIALRDALNANDRGGIKAASTALGVSSDIALRARGEIGARVRRAEMADERLSADEVRLQELVSQLEDADLTKETVDLQARDVALQAALSATAKSLTTSLVAFLR